MSKNGHEATDKNPKGAGRPKKEIDTGVLEKLAELHCNYKEMSYVMEVSVDTLKRNYADIIDKGYAQGKIKLRRAMFRNAVENDHAVMQIFLAKNLLGMSDQPRGGDDDQILPWESE
jgi:hypothetical protein